MDKYVAINGITGDTTVHLDSAKTADEAQYIVNSLLEEYEPWALQIVKGEEDE